MAEEYEVIPRPDKLADKKLIKEWTSCVLYRAFIYEKIEPNPQIAVAGAIGGCLKYRPALVEIFVKGGMRLKASRTAASNTERGIRGGVLDRVLARRARDR